MRATNESVVIARHINAFLNEYVPSQKTRSTHTLKAYSDALSLYIGLLETEKGINPSTHNSTAFCAVNIVEWLVWLMESRTCSPETCNNRLASLRAFLKYLGGRDVLYLHLSQGASQIVWHSCLGIAKASPRPIYHSKENRIIAHFMICYTALLIYRLLECKLDQYGTHFTTDNILDTLKNMNVSNTQDMYYTAAYKGSQVCTALNGLYGLGLYKKYYQPKELNKKIKKIL